MYVLKLNLLTVLSWVDMIRNSFDLMTIEFMMHAFNFSRSAPLIFLKNSHGLPTLEKKRGQTGKVEEESAKHLVSAPSLQHTQKLFLEMNETIYFPLDASLSRTPERPLISLVDTNLSCRPIP